MSSSVLAIVTTVHVSMLVVRQHRSRPSGGQALILLPALVFATVTWIVPEPGWLGAGLAIHFAWFAYCERQFPAGSLQPALARIAAGAPVNRTAPVAPTVSPKQTAASREPRTVPVLAVFDETADIKTFRIQRPEGFDFVAGQFLTVRVQVEGNAVQRAYSISSAPLAHGYMEFSVKRIGLVSSLLHANLRPGASVTVRPPSGGFTYPAGDDRPLLLLAGGIGITPLISMLRHGIAAEPSRAITLLYSIRTPDDLAFRDELAVISRRHPQVKLGIAVTQGPASDRWHRGRISAPLVRAYAPNLLHTLAYICGPQQMIDAMKQLMAELGVPAAHVRSESFSAAMKLVTTEAASEPAHASAHGHGTFQSHPSLSRAAAALVRFARTGREARVPADLTLLEAAEAEGVDIPSVCRAGSCHTCRTRVLKGDVCCESDSLSEKERADGFVLPCVSRARGDCVLEA